MLDKIPAWARHLLIVIAVAALTVLSQAVAAPGGIAAISWKDVGSGVLAAALAQVVLIVTPITRQYGVGAPPPPGEPVISDEVAPPASP